jgi:hypothetical protein
MQQQIEGPPEARQTQEKMLLFDRSFREWCNLCLFISKEPGKSSKKYLNLLNFLDKQEQMHDLAPFTTKTFLKAVNSWLLFSKTTTSLYSALIHKLLCVTSRLTENLPKPGY